MSKYKDFINSRGKELSSIPKIKANTIKEFCDGLEKLGVTNYDVVEVQEGLFIRGVDKTHYCNVLAKYQGILRTSINEDDEFVLQMFEYELKVYDYYINQDSAKVLKACGLSEEEINSNERLKRLFCEARTFYFEFL